MSEEKASAVVEKPGFIGNLQQQGDRLRDAHRRFSEYRHGVAELFAKYEHNLQIMRDDCLKDYDDVLRELEEHIRFMHGEAPASLKEGG